MASLDSKFSELEERFSGLKIQLEEEVQKKVIYFITIDD